MCPRKICAKLVCGGSPTVPTTSRKVVQKMSVGIQKCAQRLCKICTGCTCALLAEYWGKFRECACSNSAQVLKLLLNFELESEELGPQRVRGVRIIVLSFF